MFLCPSTPHTMTSTEFHLNSHLDLYKPYKNNSSITFAHNLSNSSSYSHVLLKYQAPTHVPTSWILLHSYMWTPLHFSHTHPTHLLSTNHRLIWVWTWVSMCTWTYPHCTSHNNYLDHTLNTYHITLLGQIGTWPIYSCATWTFQVILINIAPIYF